MNHPHTDDARFLELLERWLTGTFDRADERELHALAEADDFRREAWAGFSALPEAEHSVHLARLRRRLQGKKNARRVIPFGIWASAAALLLVAAALYFWPELPAWEQQPMTQAAEKTAPEATRDMATSANDIADAVPPTERDAPRSAPSPAASRARSAEPAAGTISPQDDALAAAAETLEEEAKPALPPTKADQDTGPGRAETAATVQQQPLPAQPAVQALNQAKEKAAADAPAKPAVLERKKMDWSGAARQSDTTNAALSAAPVGGWTAFRAYLRDNARLTDSARNNNISGSVYLSFSVGTDGKPANVRVLQSLGHGCDEEAERLVRRFDWAPAGAVGVEVAVPFRR